MKVFYVPFVNKFHIYGIEPVAYARILYSDMKSHFFMGLDPEDKDVRFPVPAVGVEESERRLFEMYADLGYTVL